MDKAASKAKNTAKVGEPKFSRTVFNAVIHRISENSPTIDAIRSEGISPSCFYNNVAKDNELVDVLQKAQADRDEKFKQQRIEMLEQTALSRAIEGWDEPVYQGGQLIGVKRKFSDVLLMFMLKGLKPEVYKESANINVNNANTVSNTTVEFSPEQKRRIADVVKYREEFLTSRSGAA